MRLIGGAFPPVSFHVGLGDGDGEVVLAAVLVEFLDAREIARSHVLVHVGGEQAQGEERVGSDLLDEDDEGAAQGRGAFDESAALQEVVRGFGDVVVARVGAVGAFDEREFLLRLVFGHLVVDGGVIDRDSDDGVGGHVLHPLAPVVDDAAVIQALFVFTRTHERHGAFLPACKAAPHRAAEM